MNVPAAHESCMKAPIVLRDENLTVKQQCITGSRDAAFTIIYLTVYYYALANMTE